MKTNFVKKMWCLLPLVLLLQVWGAASAPQTPMVNVDLMPDGLVVRSSAINFLQVTSITLNGKYLEIQKLKDNGLVNNRELQIPLNPQEVEDIKGGFLDISMKNGIKLSLPVLEAYTENNSTLKSTALTTRSYPAGTYQVDSSSIWPTSSGCVNQGLVTQTWSYPLEGGPQNHWYFCGQAAMSTAINYLRQGYVSDSTKISQLQWFHDELKHHQDYYTNDSINPHREANIDDLYEIMSTHKSSEFGSYIVKRGDDRQVAIDAMLSTLSSGTKYIVALSQKVVSGTTYGHYYVVYKIQYDPNSSTLGTAYFGDPYTGGLGSMTFISFLDKMRNAGYVGRYSYIAIYNN